MYRVIEKFKDLQDGDHIYEVGAEYPRKGYDAPLARIRELASDKNRLNKPLIEEVVEEVTEEPVIAEEPVEPKPKKKKAE